MAGSFVFSLLFHFDLRLVESAAEVIRQQRVTVAGQVLRRKQLSRRGVHQRKQLALIRFFHPVQMQFTHALLLPFIDVVDHRDRLRRVPHRARSGSGCLRAPTHRLRRCLHLGETVVLIDRLKRTYVRCNESLAIGAMSIQVIGRVHAQQRLKRCRIEVVIALDRHPAHAPARAQHHRIRDVDGLARGILFGMVHLHVKVAKTLEIIAQTPIALIQKILVDRTFLENRNQPLQPLAAELGAFNTHFHHRSAIG